MGVGSWEAWLRPLPSNSSHSATVMSPNHFTPGMARIARSPKEPGSGVRLPWSEGPEPRPQRG